MGRVPHWAPDNEALQRISGIGPAWAALLLRLYGSVDQFMLAEAEDLARRTCSLIGPTLARTLQARCREAGLVSDWTRLDALAAKQRPPLEGGGPGRAVLAWVHRLRNRGPPLHSRLERRSAER